jgi:hypothetical protein
MNPQTRDLHSLAELMDRRFRGPFGWRFGLDGLLGLIPVLGDMVTNAISVYIILRAAQLGVSVWKANVKNLALVDAYFANPARTKRNSGFVLAFAVAMIVALVAGAIALSVMALRALIVWMETQ